MALRHLFDTDLEPDPQASPVVPADGRIGELLGSGHGRVSGPLAGTIEWSFFEDVGETACLANPGGYIHTDDGARIRFDAMGYATRSDPGDPNWTLTASLRFDTEDDRYAWLRDTLGVWEGSFVETEGRASYRAYVVSDGA